MAVRAVKFLWISCVFEHGNPNVKIKLSSLTYPFSKLKVMKLFHIADVG